MSIININGNQRGPRYSRRLRTRHLMECASVRQVKYPDARTARPPLQDGQVGCRCSQVDEKATCRHKSICRRL